MSAKLRLTAWFTLMVLILAAMVLVFVLVINSYSITDDPAGRLVRMVMHNADEVEFDKGRFEWDDLDACRRGVYCSFYDDGGQFLMGAAPEGVSPELDFEPGVLRTFTAGEQEYFLYDFYVDMDVAGIWIRGLVSTADRSGLMHTILVLTCTLLPALLLLTVGGGWLIARGAFKPMEDILTAADSISDGDDLSAS